MRQTTKAGVLLAVAGAIAAAEVRVAVGQPVPAFTVTTVDGRQTGPTELRGKRVLYFMWASW